MAEHIRVKSPHDKTVYQWVDDQKCMIIDTITGKPVRFGKEFGNDAIGTYQEALQYVSNLLSPRCVIVKMDCIAPYIVEQE